MIIILVIVEYGGRCFWLTCIKIWSLAHPKYYNLSTFLFVPILSVPFAFLFCFVFEGSPPTVLFSNIVPVERA